MLRTHTCSALALPACPILCLPAWRPASLPHRHLSLPPPRTCPPAQVLGLPYAVASLGWGLGLFFLLLSTACSAYSAFLLAEARLHGRQQLRTCSAAVPVHACGSAGGRLLSA